MAALSETESGLLRAIAANPDDDTPRLVYADWLQENAGEIPGRKRLEMNRMAEFIRQEVAAARESDEDQQRRCQDRADHLFRLHHSRWTSPFRRTGGELEFRRGFLHRMVTLHYPHPEVEELVERIISIPQFAGIRELNLYNYPISDSHLGAIAVAPYLASINSFRSCSEGIGNDGVRGLVASPLAHQMRELSIPYAHITDIGLDAILNSMHQLRILDISFSNLTSRSVEVMANSTDLASLDNLTISDLQRNEFVAALRVARRGASQQHSPLPLPALRTLNLRLLPNDLVSHLSQSQDHIR